MTLPLASQADASTRELCVWGGFAIRATFAQTSSMPVKAFASSTLSSSPAAGVRPGEGSIQERRPRQTSPVVASRLISVILDAPKIE